MDKLDIINIFAPLLISSIGLVFTIKQFNLNKKINDDIDDNRKKMLRKKYNSGRVVLITLTAILFIVLILSGKKIYDLSSKNDELEEERSALNKIKKERIVLLLPIDPDKQSDAYDDGERQALGFIKYLKEHNKKASRYNFVIMNHKMSFDELDAAEDIVISELKEGTKYFICTMSKVALPLSAKFDTLVRQYYEGSDDPVLISTVSSAPKITDNIKKNRTYRFYIRSDEEGIELARAVDGLKRYNTATAIYVDDNYGEGAEEKFREEWEKLGHIFNNGISVGALWNENSIHDRIETQIKNRYNPENREVIFIAHYGGGLDKIINSIYKLNMRPLIVATSTLSIKSWQRPIREPLDSLNWITCVPKLKVDENELFKGDVVKDFVCFTIERLITTIEKSENTNKEFNTLWDELQVPEELDYDILPNGDSKINLKIDCNNIKK